MLDIAKKLSEQDLLIRLYSVPNASDADANDVQYQLICWVPFQRKVASENDDTIQVIGNIDRVIADTEIMNIIENTLRKDVDTFLDMKTLNTVYNNLLGNEEKFHCNYKKCIKSLILQKVNDVQFSRPKSRREAEIICSEAKRDQAIDKYMKAPDAYNEIFAAGSLIRRDILNKNKWKFTGSYDYYEIPTSLEILLKWTITGLKDTVDLNAKKKNNVYVTIKNISEITMTSTK